MRSGNTLGRWLCAGLALLGGAAAEAATEVQKQAAIDQGLAWLATNQAANGSWCQTGYCDADTASSLLAFIEQKTKPLGWNGHDYSTVVSSGLQFILDRTTSMAVNVRTDGRLADQNANGQGLLWGGDESTYVTGLVLPALSRAVTAGFVGANDLIASPNPAVNGRTWRTVIQDTVDSFLQGQTTVVNQTQPGFRGGWRYTPSTGQSDGSTAQWPVVGMMFAQTVPGITVPQYTKDELTHWIDYIQSPVDGSAGYTDAFGASGIPNSPSKTGGLLVQMAFSGYDGIGGPDDSGGTSNRAGALAYLDAHWMDPANDWLGNLGHPYAMWSIYKGLEATIGRADTSTITNLSGCGVLDPGTTCNWWEDYAQYLVGTQGGDGSWSGYVYWPQDLATAWSVNILNATEVGPSIPEPGTLALLGLGCIGFLRRRRPGA